MGHHFEPNQTSFESSLHWSKYNDARSGEVSNQTRNKTAMCCRLSMNKFEYEVGRRSRPLWSSYSTSLFMSSISLGWKEEFLSWRNLFLWSHRFHAIFHILCWTFYRRRMEELGMLLFWKCCLVESKKELDQNPSMNWVHPILVWSCRACWRSWLEGVVMVTWGLQ